MRRVCAWCNRILGGVDPGDCPDGPVSHSICDDCADNLDFQLGVTLERYLDCLKIPVALVDKEGSVLQANSAARDHADTPLPQQGGGWEGKIYECAHARLPERCSNRIHSSGCTIRSAVMKTHATGEGVTAVPALLNGCSSSQEITADYLISTKLENGIVLLRIDKVA